MQHDIDDDKVTEMYLSNCPCGVLFEMNHYLHDSKTGRIGNKIIMVYVGNLIMTYVAFGQLILHLDPSSPVSCRFMCIHICTVTRGTAPDFRIHKTMVHPCLLRIQDHTGSVLFSLFNLD